MSAQSNPQVRQTLEASETQLRARRGGTPIPSFAWQLRGDDFELIDFNEAARDATGGHIANLLGMRLTDYLGSDGEGIDVRQSYMEQRVIERELKHRSRLTGQTALRRMTFAYCAPDLVVVHSEELAQRGHYAGYGRLLHRDTKIDEVDYDFSYHSNRGVSGFLYSLQNDLPLTPATCVLRLADSPKSVAIYLVPESYDVKRLRYRYHISLSDEQPDDPNNLIAQQPRQRL